MYRSGDFLELPNGRSVRLNKDTAEIANAAVLEALSAEYPAATESQLLEKFEKTRLV